jgi:TATA-box binding protein (TBP) (component of TFIID and TFIIIB)
MTENFVWIIWIVKPVNSDTTLNPKNLPTVKINDVLNNSSLNDTELNALISKHTKSGFTNLQFKSGDKIIVLPAALNSDVFENVSTQWNKFQYVGSPFKNYR